MLYKLLSKIDKRKFAPEVVSLLGMGVLGEKLIARGIPVCCLGMKRGFPNPLKILKIVQIFGKTQPDIVQTWMYHADLMGGIGAKIAGTFPVVWNIRNGDLDPQLSSKMTVFTTKICALISSIVPIKIICCAESAQKIHGKLGYRSDRMIVIPNGFDVEKFKPDSGAREQVHRELGIEKDSIVIGLAGRFDPQKDHGGFFCAASKLIKKTNKIQFVLCGNEITGGNEALKKMIYESGVEKNVHLLGRRDDMARVTAAFDIGCSSSAYGEAFSNTIGEAMACGVPCVVTDVGDSASIVGNTGIVVPPRDPNVLYLALKEMVDMGGEKRRYLGSLARERVVKEFSLDRVVHQYEELYLSIMKSINQAKG